MSRIWLSEKENQKGQGDIYTKVLQKPGFCNRVGRFPYHSHTIASVCQPSDPTEGDKKPKVKLHIPEQTPGYCRQVDTLEAELSDLTLDRPAAVQIYKNKNYIFDLNLRCCSLILGMVANSTPESAGAVYSGPGPPGCVCF